MSVTIISVGGTIAATDKSGGDAVPELTGDDLVDEIPELGDIATIETYDFANVPSTHLSVDDIYELTKTIREIANSDTDGIVVTQGTDILEEVAYFVDLCYSGDTPVVFTGSMRTASSESPDGPANLIASVLTAKSSHARGVVVVFNERVHSPRTVTKMHSTNIDTFRSPEFGPLAVIDENRVVWRASRPADSPTFDPDPSALTNNVLTVTITADMVDCQIRAATSSDALCFATTGAGHIPPNIVPALTEIQSKGIPMVATTRCPEGRLAHNTYGFTGSERTLQELNCYYSENNLQKTRIKAIVALATNRFASAFDQP